MLTIMPPNVFANRGVTSALNKAELSYDDFLRLRKINHDDPILSKEMIDKMQSIRNAVEAPNENTLMSKVIPQGDIDLYLSGKRSTVSGFVAKADDVANCKTYMDYYEHLGLGYSWTEGDTKIYSFYKDTDTEFGVIRFKSEHVKTELTIPYGKGFGGTNTDDLPFMGNGFAGGTDVDYITPEYQFKYKEGGHSVMNGAELYKITQDGDEILMAIYNKKADNPNGGKGMFVRLEDIND